VIYLSHGINLTTCTDNLLDINITLLSNHLHPKLRLTKFNAIFQSICQSITSYHQCNLFSEDSLNLKLENDDNT